MANRRSSQPSDSRGIGGIDELEYGCLFVGPPRSGTTLMASILDAHRAITISTELNLLARLEAGASRESMIREIREKSAQQARDGMRWNGYPYDIPGQHQGRGGPLHVIGDKRAARTIIAIDEQPSRVDRLERALGAPLRFIYMIRNPIDTITTIAHERERPLDEKIESFFSMTKQVERLAERIGGDRVRSVHLMDLVADPAGVVSSICRFLGQDAPADYLTAVKARVLPEVPTTRHRGEWTPTRIRRVEAGCEAAAPLRRYLESMGDPDTAAPRAS